MPDDLSTSSNPLAFIGTGLDAAQDWLKQQYFAPVGPEGANSATNIGRHALAIGYNLLKGGRASAEDLYNTLTGGISGTLSPEDLRAGLARGTAQIGLGLIDPEAEIPAGGNLLSFAGYKGTTKRLAAEGAGDVALPTPGISVVHATPSLLKSAGAGNVDDWGGEFAAYDPTQGWMGTHAGTPLAAMDRLSSVLQKNLADPQELEDLHFGGKNPMAYASTLQPNKIIDLTDTGSWSHPAIASELEDMGLFTPEQATAVAAGRLNPVEWLRDQGYDTIRYINAHEHRGSTSYWAIGPGVAKSTYGLYDMPEAPLGRLGAPSEFDPTINPRGGWGQQVSMTPQGAMAEFPQSRLMVGGKEFPGTSDPEIGKTVANIKNWENSGHSDPVQAVKDNLADDISYYTGGSQRKLASAQRQLDWLNNNSVELDRTGAPGVHHIEVKPDVEDLLDFDKPWKDQSPSVQKGLADLGYNGMHPSTPYFRGTAADAHTQVGDLMGIGKSTDEMEQMYKDLSADPDAKIVPTQWVKDNLPSLMAKGSGGEVMDYISPSTSARLFGHLNDWKDATDWLAQNAVGGYNRGGFHADSMGRDIYEDLAGISQSPKQASLLLKHKGIPGAYWADSTGGQHATIFHPSDLEITSLEGHPLIPVDQMPEFPSTGARTLGISPLQRVAPVDGGTP